MSAAGQVDADRGFEQCIICGDAWSDPTQSLTSYGHALPSELYRWASSWIEPPQRYSAMPSQIRAASTGSGFTSRHLEGVALYSLVLCAPTGIASPLDLARNSQRLTRIPFYEIVSASPRIEFRSQVRLIQNALAISVSEIALMLGVSRQAIYKWMSGGPMTEVFRERLDELAAAASVLAPFSKNTGLQVSKRRDARGHTLVDVFRSQGSACTWARELVRTLRSEEEQRKAVDRLLATHRRASAVRGEMGVPMLNEQDD